VVSQKSFRLILLGLAGVAVLAVGLAFQRSAGAFSLLDGLDISVVFSPSPTPAPSAWTFQDKIAEAKQMLAGMTLKVGTANISYVENRISSTGSISKKTIKDPEREIALAALNTETGEISIFKITKRGAELIAPSDWQITIISRVNGINWNAWNTSYRVEYPENNVIIANLYPDEKNKTMSRVVKGKRSYYVSQTIDYKFYSPYSPDLHKPELINAGKRYIRDMVAQALSELQQSATGSISIPGSSVHDVWKDKAEYFARIPLLEQSDLTEFILDPDTTVDRIYTLIGANGSGAFAGTCNSSSACGWVQFTPGTYKMIVKTYPSAGLMKDFLAGAADHENSIKAAILLYDYNLKGLIKSNGQKVLQDPRLEEYLAASYNGSPNRTTKSLAASIFHAVEDWIDALTSKKGGLANETRGYLVKLRYLQEHSS